LSNNVSHKKKKERICVILDNGNKCTDSSLIKSVLIKTGMMVDVLIWRVVVGAW
jgi:hypothetical protein